MAKRKNRIVHDADLANRTDTVVEAWGPADDWQLIMWLFAVPAFYYQLRVSLGIASVEERTIRERLGEAKESPRFGAQLIAFPNVAPEMRIQALQKIADTRTSMAAMLSSTSVTTMSA